MHLFKKQFFYGFWIMLFLQQCHWQTQFSVMPGNLTGVEFENTITETPANNIMTYEYLYNGGGVAVGDINRDGLTDLYLSGNSVPNKLYLNKGKWVFEDITKQANIIERDDWKTGVSMVDINGDGWLDIYLCYSGNAPREGFNKPVIRDYPKRANQLFINNGCEKGGIPTFTEKAKAYGLDAIGTFSTQAYFFDFDLDGDLDLFLLNHANMFYSVFHNVQRLRNLRHPYFGNKLYRNDNGHFTEISEQAGIHGSGLNFGLSAAISDINDDQWPDIYVGNDYDEQDFCYINNHDGTFREVSHLLFGHLSKSSMGSDIADINNDGLKDIFVADMIPEDNHRIKQLKGPDGYHQYKMAYDSGYHHQYMRNMLHLNLGLAPDSLPRFGEIGQLAGISNTDWSWSPLFADLDNDGLKDLFITNGYLRDFTNLDFMKFVIRNTVNEANDNNRPVNLLALINKTETTKLNNYLFVNTNGIQFENRTIAWGFDQNTISNAAAYADFDNDGDYDLVVSNLNDPVLVYQNHQDKIQKNNYIKIRLEGSGRNVHALGAKVSLMLDDKKIIHENYFTRGYQSSVEPQLTIGIGKSEKIREIIVDWPDKLRSVLSNVQVNQTIVIRENENADLYKRPLDAREPFFKEVTINAGLDFKHHENPYADFNYQGLLPYKLSQLGGKMTVGDINGDGNDDVFFGGAAGQSGALYYGNDDGKLTISTSQPWEKDKNCEDLESLFFDADNDGDLDLFVVGGGNEFPVGSPYLQDRLYINNGLNDFNKIELPAESISGSCVSGADYDKDGDMDLFVGGRLVPQNYPLTAESLLLRNDTKNGKIIFTEVLSEINPDLKNIGMVTDACWVDLNNDTWPDLVIVGDWMPIRIFINEQGKLQEQKQPAGAIKSNGWWRKILPGDFDEDGDIDFLIGNAGSNLQLKTNQAEPMTYYVQDLNNDGKIDPILCSFNQGKSYPFARRDDLIRQVGPMNKKFTSYSAYADAKIEDIVDAKDIHPYLTTTTLNSSYLENNGHGQFLLKPLPLMAQVSMINGFILDDFDGDGTKEVLAAGNFFPYNTQLGRSDASQGILLKFDKKEILVYKPKVPLWLTGDIRDIGIMRFNQTNKRIVVSRNNEKAGLFEYPEVR